MPYNITYTTRVTFYLMDGQRRLTTPATEHEHVAIWHKLLSDPGAIYTFPHGGDTIHLPARAVSYMATTPIPDYLHAAVELWQHPDSGELYLRDPEQPTACPLTFDPLDPPRGAHQFAGDALALLDGDVDMEDITGTPAPLDRLRHIATYRTRGASRPRLASTAPNWPTERLRVYLGLPDSAWTSPQDDEQ